MIKKEEVVEAGKFLKPHGLAGELNAVLDPQIDLDAVRCIVVDVNGILVPFFIESWRGKGTEACLIKLDGFDTAESVMPFMGEEIYVLREDLPESEFNDSNGGFYLSDLMGYTILDLKGKKVAVIEDFDDSTQNVILLAKTDDGTNVYIPLAEEFIMGIEPENKMITMDLPDGILNLN